MTGHAGSGGRWRHWPWPGSWWPGGSAAWWPSPSARAPRMSLRHRCPPA
ncbi:hypothetical protein ACFFX0_16170 [Citricoccus parietis]|uniref:Uncharacterized protein n=1 Tax=Citricoccus parietis TaxID=592307 RepID=A0ABV5G1W5_9MICC